MPPDLDSANAFRLEATRQFAHTMVVVDDQASQSQGVAEEKVGTVSTPGRAAARASVDKADKSENEYAGGDTLHSLDAKSLIENAMDLGLVCSVLRPGENENLTDRVGRAARHADIVVLDWVIHGDDGATAKSVISRIVKEDAESNGRLRLIAVYTGERNRQRILNEILGACREDDKRNRGFRKRDNAAIVSNDGLRIVYLFKKHGTVLHGKLATYQVAEADLPIRLQSEYSILSEGLLTNVALATIAAIRAVANHVVAKFGGEMDGPFFHHRATLQFPTDAEDYAVNIVLSELKSTLDRQGVAGTFAGENAIKHRIHEIALGQDVLGMEYETGDKTNKFQISTDIVVKAVTDGWSSAHSDITGGNVPPKRQLSRGFSSLFTAGDLTTAKLAMLEFASLTGVRAHPGSHQYKSGTVVPKLGLGTVVQDEKKKYWMCLQASCDAVRLTKETTFVFAPLRVDSSSPTDVVPVAVANGLTGYVELSLEDKAYTKPLSVEFKPDPSARAVTARKVEHRRGLYFEGTDQVYLKWIADLKQRRAVRTSRKLGIDMERLGFDEFEPFRRKD